MHPRGVAYDKNTRTLIATFKDYSTARQAEQELENEGFASDQVQIESNQNSAGAGSNGGHEADCKNADEHQSELAGWNSLFGSDHEDEDRAGYEAALANGSTILRATVPGNSVDSVAEILNRRGAIDVDQSNNSASLETNGKRAVQYGVVRVYSHMVSQPTEEKVSLREERVNVERRQVNREINPEDVSAFRTETTRQSVRQTEELPATP